MEWPPTPKQGSVVSNNSIKYQKQRKYLNQISNKRDLGSRKKRKGLALEPSIETGADLLKRTIIVTPEVKRTNAVLRFEPH